MKIRTISSVVVLWVMFTSMVFIQEVPVFAQDDAALTELEKLDVDTSLEDEFAWLKAETFVITASRVLENIKKSAASITVITDKEIQLMGARNLIEVLRTVPGMSSRYSHDGGYKFDARGLMSSAGQDVLILMNSHPVNENISGGATSAYDTVMLDNVQRIEVIRGPGSALYGANAFAAVINIITKEAKEIEGLEATVRGGSFSTQQYNLLFGKTSNDFSVAFNFNYFDTDGFEGEIAQDRQTLFDQFLGTNASLAPGQTSERDNHYDIALTARYKGFKLESRYINREYDAPVGPVDILTEKNIAPVEHYYVTLGYEGSPMEGLNLSGKVYRNYDFAENDAQGLPAGAPAITPFGPVIMPEGALYKVSTKNNKTGVELMATYKLADSNTVVGGGTYEKMELYDTHYEANFRYLALDPTTGLVIIEPFPAVQDLSDPENNVNQDDSRTFKALFLEDLWDLTDTLRLTVGARYDDYSDFGNSFNPRAGLTWEFSKGYDVKLLYGRAFRAPSFYELNSQNNPLIIGNPDLDPETVNTYEVSFGAAIGEDLKGRITGFYNSIQDSIIQVPELGGFVFRNAEELRSQGAEVELQYDFGKGAYVAANYTYQDVKNVDTDEKSWKVPTHKGNIMANFRLTKYFNLLTNVYFQGKYDRGEGDLREDNDGFVLLDATLIAKNFIEGLEIRGSVYNLLDKEYTFPTAAGTLPVDIPMPGRTFMVELRYKLPL